MANYNDAARQIENATAEAERIVSGAQTEARQSLYMSGSGAALASEALCLTSVMAWLG